MSPRHEEYVGLEEPGAGNAAGGRDFYFGTVLRTDRPAAPARVDLTALLAGRLLVQSSSGGGKSWALRLICERLLARGVQVVVLDPEGEFATLREKYPLVLAAPGGDVEARPRTAAKLARRLLESGAPAVCDLYELPMADRRMFVGNFLGAMVEAPKALWREVVVVLDEAHAFAPESGRGESSALDAVMSMASRGRKRSYCLVVATQRLAKLHKDVAAECQNVLSGLTTLDVDRKRAADLLGVSREGLRDFQRAVKVLPPGSFWALGRAFGAAGDPIAIQVGRVETTHPEPGRASAAAPPAPADFAATIARFADLPREAAEDQSQLERLRTDVAELSRGKVLLEARLREAEERAQRAVDAAQIAVDAAPAVHNLVRTVAPAGLAMRLTTLASELREVATHASNRLATAASHLVDEARALDALPDEATDVTPLPPSTVVKVDRRSAYPEELLAAGRTSPLAPVVRGENGRRVALPSEKHAADHDVPFPAGMRRLLVVYNGFRSDPIDNATAAICSLMSPGGGTFKKYRGILVGRGLVVLERGVGRSTDAGRDLVAKLPGGVLYDLTPAALVAEWRGKLDGRRRDLLDYGALEAGPEHPLPRADIARGVGMDASGGTFKKYFGELVGLGLFVRRSGARYCVHAALALPRRAA